MIRPVVLGHFDSAEKLAVAVRTLRGTKWAEVLECFLPFPDHHVEQELYSGRPESPVRTFVLLAGIGGCLGAFLVASWMSLDYPLQVSAKPLLSFPAFVVIAFECTILCAAGAAVLSLFWFSKVPDAEFHPEYRPEFSEGVFGLTVRAEEGETEMVGRTLLEQGASKVEVVHVRV